VRYDDDIVMGFEHEGEARRFVADISSRYRCPEKTRPIEFGRYAAERRARRGLGKPETFNFLGFTPSVAGPDRASSSSSGRRAEIGCEPSCEPSRKNCSDECMNLSHYRVSG
jgi:hypothetical protein